MEHEGFRVDVAQVLDPPPEVEAADPGVEIEKAIYRAARGVGVFEDGAHGEVGDGAEGCAQRWRA